MASTCVLIGVPDERIHSGNSDWATNKIGGFADFPHSVIRRPTCRICGHLQLLVVQIYCPLQSSQYHRTIYVFCCPIKTCWSENNGWTIWRVQSLEVKHKQEKPTTKHAQQPALGFQLNVQKNTKVDFTWNDTEDGWGDEDQVSYDEEKIKNDVASNPNEQTLPEVTSSFKHLTLEGKDLFTKIQSKTEDEQGPCFISYYINVFDEQEMGEYDTNQDNYIKTLLVGYEADSPMTQVNHDGTEGLSMNSKEPYERSDHRDKNFHKFRKKVALCKEQVIRYSYMGSPLLLAESELPPVEHCAHCGKQLAFEFQLMPGLIPFLKSESAEEDCIEFGTVLVYTCSGSCWDDVTNKVIAERALYLPDPDLKFFKTQKT